MASSSSSSDPLVEPLSHAPPARLRRVLSIQSHVVHGVVGNRASALALALAGLDVDVLNTVQLAHHTGYRGRAPRGQRLGGDEVAALLDGLFDAGLARGLGAVISGYSSSAAALRAVAAFVRRLRDQRRRRAEAGAEVGAGAEAEADDAAVTFLCDPVMGDGGRLYVPAELVPVYRDELVPLASVLTPNQTELELLSGVKVADLASARAALDALHALGARTVVVTSTDVALALRPRVGGIGVVGGAGLDADADAGADGTDALLLVASCPWSEVRASALFAPALAAAATRPSHARFAVRVPRIAWSFTGTGDLAAALLLAQRGAHAGDLVLAVENVAAALLAVCLRTRARYRLCEAALRGDAGAAAAFRADGVEALRAEADASERAAAEAGVAAAAPVAAWNELQVVASRGDIEAPDAARRRFGLRAELLEEALL